MRSTAKLAFIFSLIVLVCGASAAVSWPLSVQSACPFHRHLPPSQAPADDNCCHAEHASALLQKPITIRPDALISLPLHSISTPTVKRPFPVLGRHLSVPGSPPSSLPLRI